MQVVAEAGDGADAYRVYKEARPDLVIMDLSMPGIGGVEAIRRIRQWDKSARILVFTMHQSAAYAVQAIKAGARGFVTKSNPPEALLRAIAEVMAGRIALSPDIDHELAINRLADEPSAIDALSPREFEILRMLLAEKSVDEIAETLHISVKTAANTRYHDPRQARRRLRHRTGTPGAAPADHRGGGYRELVGETCHAQIPLVLRTGSRHSHQQNITGRDTCRPFSVRANIVTAWWRTGRSCPTAGS